MQISKAGRPILSLDDWREHAPPKRPGQWKAYRSAMEVARAWLESIPRLPPEVTAALGTHDSFAAVSTWTAEPEVRVRFDAHAGEPRNSDLIVHASDRFGQFVIAVEAKADESFGETVAQADGAAAKRKEKNPRSRGKERLDGLCQALFGSTFSDDPSLGTFRYQLLTATAGALAAAQAARATRAVLLVHEFRSAKTSAAKHAANAEALDAFVSRLTKGVTPRIEPGRLYALPTPGAPLFAAAPPLYVAKVTRTIAP